MGRVWPLLTAGILVSWAQVHQRAAFRISAEDPSGTQPTDFLFTSARAGGIGTSGTRAGVPCLSYPTTDIDRHSEFHVRSTGLQVAVDPESAQVEMDQVESGRDQRTGGTQAVMRAVDILMAVAEGPILLPDLVAKTGIPKPTCHRIARALAERGLLQTSGRSGYRIGPVLKNLAQTGDG
jgi:hypothetical protein